MQDRGQTEERIVEVKSALKKYSDALVKGTIKPVAGKSAPKEAEKKEVKEHEEKPAH